MGGRVLARLVDLVDHLHLVVGPIVLGRGVRLWDGLEGVEERFDIEATPSPSGVVHYVWTRRALTSPLDVSAPTECARRRRAGPV